MAIITSIGTTSSLVSGKVSPKVFLLEAGEFSPLDLSPILALQSTRIEGYSTSLPIMKVRRVNEGDEVDIYGWNPSDPRQYQTSAGGAYETTESLLYPAEQFFVVIQYDQSGNGNNAVQTTQASQPELTWEGITFGSEEVTNDDMELFTAGFADDWVKYGAQTFEEENVIVHSGSGSQKITNIDDGGVMGMRQNVATIAGTNYTLSAWVYLSSARTVRITPSGTFGGSAVLFSVPASTWTELVVNIKASGTGVGIMYVFHNAAEATTGDIMYIDDASVKEVLSWGLPQLYFDGVDDYLATAAPLMNGLTKATMVVRTAARYMPSDGSPTQRHLFGEGSNESAGSGFNFREANNQFLGSFYDGTNASYKVLAFDDETEQDFINWSSKVDTTGDGLEYLYKNITEYVATSGSALTSAISSVIVCKLGGDGSGRHWHGYVSSAYIYPIAMTQSQITELNTYLDVEV